MVQPRFVREQTIVSCVASAPKRCRAQQRLKPQTSKGAAAKNEQQVNEQQINKSNVEKTKLRAIICSPTAVSANKVSCLRHNCSRDSVHQRNALGARWSKTGNVLGRYHNANDLGRRFGGGGHRACRNIWSGRGASQRRSYPRSGDSDRQRHDGPTLAMGQRWWPLAMGQPRRALAMGQRWWPLAMGQPRRPLAMGQPRVLSEIVKLTATRTTGRPAESGRPFPCLRKRGLRKRDNRICHGHLSLLASGGRRGVVPHLRWSCPA